MSRHASLFPSDYFDARQRFRKLADQYHWQLTSHSLPKTASTGSDHLSVEVATKGDSAAPLLLATSGLHGVEGFFGSAVQQAVLQSYGSQLADHRVVLVHALNPFGFLHRRRANENNIDLNRNFLLIGKSFQGAHSLYERLNPLINPAQPSGSASFYLRALGSLLRHGKQSIAAALVAGQYQFPNGLYFGGSQPAWTQQFLDASIDEIVGDSQTIIHLDLHSGLGSFGKHIMMMEPGCDATTYEFATHQFAEHNVLLPRGNEKLYQAQGNLGAWLQNRFTSRRYMYFCLEFGTFPSLFVLKALCDENAAFQRFGLESKQHKQASSHLLSAFVPRSRRWRETVVASSLEILQKAEKACQLSTANGST